MHFWLSQSLDIPNSTVCTSLLEFLMSCFYSQCLRISSEPLVQETAEFQGLSFFLFCCLNLKARLVCAQSFKKSSGISKIIFKKFTAGEKMLDFCDFFLKNFFVFLFYRHANWFGFPINSPHKTVCPWHESSLDSSKTIGKTHLYHWKQAPFR